MNVVWTEMAAPQLQAIRDYLSYLKMSEQSVILDAIEQHMKAIDLSTSSPTLKEVLQLAGEDNVILKTPEGRQYVLAEIDDFAEEVQAVLQNKELMRLLEERSSEANRVPLRQVREQLQGKKRGQRKGKEKGSGAFSDQ